jgi:uncharacterized membrane protein YcaP (DUF421 family)
MGKRQLGELQPYELVITIMLSDLAVLPMQDTRLPLLLGIIPIVTLLMIKTILTELQMKFPLIAKIIDGTPVILIHNGKIQIKNLKDQKMTVKNLLEEIREKGYLDIEQIKFAILENNGSVSIFPHDAISPVTKGDLDIQILHRNLPKILFLDGNLHINSLTEIGKDFNWLSNKLSELNAPPLNKLFLVIFTSEKKIFFQEYAQLNKGSDL